MITIVCLRNLENLWTSPYFAMRFRNFSLRWGRFGCQFQSQCRPTLLQLNSSLPGILEPNFMRIWLFWLEFLLKKKGLQKTIENVKAVFPVMPCETWHCRAMPAEDSDRVRSSAEIVHTIHHSYHVPSRPQYVRVHVPGPTVLKPVGNLSSSSMMWNMLWRVWCSPGYQDFAPVMWNMKHVQCLKSDPSFECC